MTSKQLRFGIYPGGVVGTPTGASESKPDDSSKIHQALDALQGDEREFLVRGYLHFAGEAAESEEPHPANAAQYATNGRKLDLVLCFRDAGGHIDSWTTWVREKIRAHAACLATVSVTLEPNLALPHMAMDGNFPAVIPALVQGIAAAQEEVKSGGLNIAVGFCASPTFGPKASFWSELRDAGGDGFAGQLDYAGLDFYVDVFYPADDIRGAVRDQLRQFREVDLKAAGISPSTPIHVCENGWPTSSTRSVQRQAQVMETMVRTIYEVRAEFNIERYQWFSLRDSDSGKDEIFSRFGLLYDDYTPKPAFEVYRKLVRELG